MEVNLTEVTEHLQLDLFVDWHVDLGKIWLKSVFFICAECQKISVITQRNSAQSDVTLCYSKRVTNNDVTMRLMHTAIE